MTDLAANLADRLLMAALTAVVIVLSQIRPAEPALVGRFHDDGIYALTAKSLAEGRGYRAGHLPGQPPQTKYPPLYPAALAALWWLYPDFPSNVRLLEWIGVVAGAISVAGGYAFLVRFGYATRLVALTAALSVATAPAFLDMCTRLMAEMPFAAVLLLSLWRLERSIRDHEGHVPSVWLGVTVALPAMCRTPGVVLVPLALIVLSRRVRPIRAVALGSLFVLGPWIVWVLTNAHRFRTDPVTGYYTDYIGWWADMGPSALGRVATANLYFVLQAVAGRSAEGFSTLLERLPNGLALVALAGLIAVPGWLRDLRSGRLLAWFLAAYLGLVLLWPWPSARFVLPVQVFAAAYLFRPISNWPRATLVLAVLAVSANLWALSEVWADPRGKAGRESAERLLEWVRTNTPTDAVVASPADPVVALYTGRTAFNPFVARPGPLFYGVPGEAFPPPEKISETLRAFRAGFVVHLPVTAGDESEYFRRYELLEREGQFRRIFADPMDRRFAVYRVELPR